MEWRTVERLPAYEVSDTGLVRHKKTQRMLKPNYNNHGIRRFYMYDKSKSPRPRSIVYARDLVAQAFVPNPNNYTLVKHKDGDIGNVNADNLEWVED